MLPAVGAGVVPEKKGKSGRAEQRDALREYYEQFAG